MMSPQETLDRVTTHLIWNGVGSLPFWFLGDVVNANATISDVAQQLRVAAEQGAAFVSQLHECTDDERYELNKLILMIARMSDALVGEAVNPLPSCLVPVREAMPDVREVG